VGGFPGLEMETTPSSETKYFIKNYIMDSQEERKERYIVRRLSLSGDTDLNKMDILEDTSLSEETNSRLTQLHR
jgi:hypothetical protein